MKPLNPLFKVEVREEKQNEITKNKHSGVNIMSLLVMLVFVSFYFLFLFIYNVGFDRIISIVFIAASFILCLMSYFMIRTGYNKSFSICLLFSISLSLFLAFSSRLLNDVLLNINSGDNIIENKFSFVFITITFGIVITLFVTEIFYYFNVFSIRHFYFKFSLILLTVLIMGLIVSITLLNSVSCFYLRENLIPYILTISYFSFFSVYYKEEIRKVLDLNIKKRELVNISLIMVTLPIFIIPECINMLLNCKKSR